MNVGLLYTPVSIYQMTRGSLVLFVGFLSVAFLRRRLWLYQLGLFKCSMSLLYLNGARWTSLIIVMGGVALVGFSGSLIKDTVKEALNSLLVKANGNADLPPPESTETPEATTVLVGQSLPPFYVCMGYSDSFIDRRVFHLVCSSLVSRHPLLHSHP